MSQNQIRKLGYPITGNCLQGDDGPAGNQGIPGERGPVGEPGEDGALVSGLFPGSGSRFRLGSKSRLSRERKVSLATRAILETTQSTVRAPTARPLQPSNRRPCSRTRCRLRPKHRLQRLHLWRADTEEDARSCCRQCADKEFPTSKKIIAPFNTHSVHNLSCYVICVSKRSSKTAMRKSQINLFP